MRLTRPRSRPMWARPLGVALVLALLSALMLPSTASASGTLDQQATAGDAGNETSIGGKYSAAQTFTAGLSGTLTEVEVYISGQSDPITVNIEGVNADGSPNDSDVLATTTVPPADIPGLGSPEWLAVPINTSSTAGTQYAIVLSAPTNPLVTWYLSSSNYSGGSPWIKGSGGWESFSYDAPSFMFQTYVTGPPVVTKTTVQSASVGYSYSSSSVPLSATVTGTPAVSEGTVRFAVTNSQGAAVGTPVSASVQNGDASANYTLPAGSLPGDYTVTASYTDTLDSEANFGASNNTGTLAVLDDLAPTTTASFGSYTPGTWANQDVQITLSAVDNPDPGGSGVAATYYAVDNPACTATAGGLANCTTYTGPFTVSTEGANTLTYFSVDKAGNIEAASSAAIMVDTEPPTITATLKPDPALTGWYNQSTGAPTVYFTCSDKISGIPAGACPAPFKFPDGANQSYTGTVTDNAGNSASATVRSVDVDLTPPVVTYTGNAGAYTVDQQVDITCTATDAVSGVASTSCQDIKGPAYSFGLGQHSYSATATDKAGNSGSGSTSFVVGTAVLTVTATSTTMTYGGPVPTITPIYSVSPVSLSTAPTCSTTASSSSPVGSYPATCSGAVDADYAIGYVAGTVDVTPAPLTATASSATFTQGGTVPVITPSYAGFVNRDGPASLSTAPTCTTTATSSSPPGTYPSTCTGAVGANYAISYEAGTVTVKAGAATSTPPASSTTTTTTADSTPPAGSTTTTTTATPAGSTTTTTTATPASSTTTTTTATPASSTTTTTAATPAPLEDFPGAGLTYPNGAIVRFGAKEYVLAGGRAFAASGSRLSALEKVDHARVVAAAPGAAAPTGAAVRAGTLLSTRAVDGSPTIYVVGTDGELHGFSSAGQFFADGYDAALVVTVPGLGGLGTGPTAGVEGPAVSALSTRADGAIVDSSGTFYVFAGGRAFGIASAAQLARVRTADPAGVLHGPVGAAERLAGMASGALLSAPGKVYVSYQGSVYLFKSLARLAADGYAGTAAVPVPGRGGLNVVPYNGG